MNVLYVTQYFAPEIGAGAVRAMNIAKCLLKLGHEVQVISEIPNYPDGDVPEKYRHKLLWKERLEGIDVVRSYVHASDRNSFFKKLSFYLSFMVSSSICGLKCLRADLIIATSPPPTVGVSGYLISKMRKTRLLLDIRDIWPDSIAEVGSLSKTSLFYYALKKIERFLYSKADIISVAVQGLEKRVKERTSTTVCHLPNTVNMDSFKTKHSAETTKKNLGVAEKFVVLYAGNHGLAQGLEFVMQSAFELKRFKDILFLFVGEGVKKAELMTQTDRLGLTNIIFLGKRSHKEMPDVISVSDVCLVPLKKSDLFLNALPSKMFEYMALKKPVIVSIKGEAEELLKDANAGISIKPENSGELYDAILKLYNDRTLCRFFGENGYRYIKKFYSQQNQLVSCRKLLKRI